MKQEDSSRNWLRLKEPEAARVVADPQSRRFLEPDVPAVWDTWGMVRLNHQEAKALQREIAGLLRRYRDRRISCAYQVSLSVTRLHYGLLDTSITSSIRAY